MREESAMMLPKLLACATGRMELPFTEIDKAMRATYLVERSWV